MKKKTIIYGGAFNPPTLAHFKILEACIEYASKIDAEIWLLPSGSRFDKKIDTSIQQRLELIEGMIEDCTHQTPIRIETCELYRDCEVETFDTAQELTNKHLDRDFIWVFGADSTQTILSWKGGKWIADNLNMLLIERPGSLINPIIKNWESLTIPQMDISSTEVRKRIENGEDFTELVSATVLALLKKKPEKAFA